MKSPPKDLEYSTLPPHVRREVETWQKVLKFAVNCRPLRPILTQIASGRRVGVATAYRKLRAFERHGWRGLVNRAKFPMQTSVPSHEFRAFLHALWLVNKKRYRIPHEQVVAMWKGGAETPGYPDRPKARPSADYPDGCTYANFVYHINTFEANHPKQFKCRPATNAAEE